jgi:hypothetical protein
MEARASSGGAIQEHNRKRGGEWEDGQHDLELTTMSMTMSKEMGEAWNIVMDDEMTIGMQANVVGWLVDARLLWEDVGGFRSTTGRTRIEWRSRPIVDLTEECMNS